MSKQMKLSLNKEIILSMTEAETVAQGALGTRWCASDPCLSDMCGYTIWKFATHCYIP